uniref:Cytochrome c oxidase subunit 3 n=1 Tax=Solanum lycopersicum TaxID=4081 RepID=K4BER7_SOLLC
MGSSFYTRGEGKTSSLCLSIIFKIICGIPQYLFHQTKKHHIGFEAAAWYWYFVDVVRLFLFVSINW